jgi:3-dehydroquinate synthetase
MRGATYYRSCLGVKGPNSPTLQPPNSRENVKALTSEPVQLDKDVRFGVIQYDFCVRSGPSAWLDLQKRLKELDVDVLLLVVDSGIPYQIVARTESSLTCVARTKKLVVPSGEASKVMATLDQLFDEAIEAGISRRSVVVALGGGTIGNIAGLLAALLFRGIRLVHMPTTLLGMSDSALSLKQAVNSRYGKNHIGTFHPPTLVWNHLDFLATLPPDEIRSALCEMIKNVLGIVPERYDDVAHWLRPDGHYTMQRLANFIDLCVDAKTKVMAREQYEKGEALVLEYGHTVGHAAEILSKGRLRHGFAVGLGMLAAAQISRRLGHLSRSDETAHIELLRLNGVPSGAMAAFDADALLDVCRRDNKRGYVPTQNGKIDFILLEGLGHPLMHNGSLITQVDEAVVRLGITALINSDGLPGR